MQGILCNSLISDRKGRTHSSKRPHIGRKFRQFPVKFPVLRESAQSVGGSHRGIGSGRVATWSLSWDIGQIDCCRHAVSGPLWRMQMIFRALAAALLLMATSVAFAQAPSTASGRTKRKAISSSRISASRAAKPCRRSISTTPRWARHSAMLRRHHQCGDSGRVQERAPEGRSLTYAPAIPMRRPAESGTGRSAWEAFICASRAMTSCGNAAVFLDVMSTCSDRFSEVADTQPPVA